MYSVQREREIHLFPDQLQQNKISSSSSHNDHYDLDTLLCLVYSEGSYCFRFAPSQHWSKHSSCNYLAFSPFTMCLEGHYWMYLRLYFSVYISFYKITWFIRDLAPNLAKDWPQGRSFVSSFCKEKIVAARSPGVCEQCFNVGERFVISIIKNKHRQL